VRPLVGAWPKAGGEPLITEPQRGTLDTPPLAPATEYAATHRIRQESREGRPAFALVQANPGGVTAEPATTLLVSQQPRDPPVPGTLANRRSVPARAGTTGPRCGQHRTFSAGANRRGRYSPCCHVLIQCAGDRKRATQKVGRHSACSLPSISRCGGARCRRGVLQRRNSFVADPSATPTQEGLAFAPSLGPAQSCLGEGLHVGHCALAVRLLRNGLPIHCQTAVRSVPH
jgi:hypothetical protein